MAGKNFGLWTEIYRPITFSDIVAPESLLQYCEKSKNNGEIDNLLFSGPAGTGKCLDYDEEIEIMVTEDFYNKYLV